MQPERQMTTDPRQYLLICSGRRETFYPPALLGFNQSAGATDLKVPTLCHLEIQVHHFHLGCPRLSWHAVTFQIQWLVSDPTLLQPGLKQVSWPTLLWSVNCLMFRLLHRCFLISSVATVTVAIGWYTWTAIANRFYMLLGDVVAKWLPRGFL